MGSMLYKRCMLLFRIFSLAAVVLFNLAAAPRQESTGTLVVTDVHTDTFPALEVEFEVYNPLGGFVTNLRPEDLTITEAGEPRSLKTLETINPGVQFTIAINLSPELSNRFAGKTRLENILLRLDVWVKSQAKGSMDQVSLATNTGLQLIRSRTPEEWTSALTNLGSIDLNAEQSNLTALTRAVDLATDPSAEGDMKRAILYITPLPGISALEALPNLADRAANQGTKIFVWLVGSASSASAAPEQYAAIENLAVQTGGSIFVYSGQEALPDPDGYLNPMRYYYRAAFDSAVQASGSYDIGVEISRDGLVWTTEPRPVYFNVQPPNPIFLSPPSMIERVWGEAQGQEESVLFPDRVTLQIVVEFVDGHPRALRASRLLVDDQLVVENVREPYDTFTWDLSGYDSSARHLLVVEVEDVLGLTRRSIETPVDISVEAAKPNAVKSLFTTSNLLIFGGILGAGIVLVLGMGALGKRVQRMSAATRKAYKDPLTQPLPEHKDMIQPVNKASSVNRPTWPRYAVSSLSSAPAWLLRVPDTGSLVKAAEKSEISPPSNPASAIPLSRRETRLGSDEHLVDFKINSPTVSPQHARIRQTAEGGFLIQDAGSTAGTWINYAPVPAKGILLRHGDLVQIGRVSFRFELANPPEERQIQISDRRELP